MAGNKSEVTDAEKLWVESDVVPKIVEALGDDRIFRCKVKASLRYVLASTIFMVELTFLAGNEKPGEKKKFVVKVAPQKESMRAYFKTDILFRNEILFYERLGKNWGDYPKCVLTISEPVERAVIVLEDVTQRGYRNLRHGEKLGMERVLAAVREIGKFHGRGYVLKEKNPEEFFKVARGVREAMYSASAHPAWIEIINALAPRPVNYLRSVAKFDAAFCDKISGSLSSVHEKILQDCMKPRNELAVLCHGDFTATNVLFREEDGGGIGAMLIDFAQLRFASPAIDLSPIFYLDCDAEMRKDFPLLFRAYHDAVVERLEADGVRDPEKYSFTNFLNDYKRHAIFGCVMAFFFKPVVLLSHEILESVDAINKTSEYIGFVNASGGDELSKKLADMLLELKDNGYLDHLL